MNYAIKITIILMLLAVSGESLDLGIKSGGHFKKKFALLFIFGTLVTQLIFTNHLLPFLLATLLFVNFIKGVENIRLKLASTLLLFSLVIFVNLIFQIINCLIDQKKIQELLLFCSSIVIRDTAASLYGYFFSGTTITQLSAKKTWEGASFGLLITLIFQLVLLNTGQLSWLLALAQGLIVGIFGQVADLIESSIKRAANVRHSGNLFGSRGGVLDLFDSILFTLPIWYLFIVLSS